MDERVTGLLLGANSRGLTQGGAQPVLEGASGRETAYIEGDGSSSRSGEK